MKIAYYMPFKPLGHANPSGDLVIGSELFDHLKTKGHEIELASRLRCRWIYYRPIKLGQLAYEKKRVIAAGREQKPQLWLSYHCYYKAPDLLGPGVAARLAIPYVIFQGIYSTKRRKRLKTLPGFLLNRLSLKKADLVFTNKQRDYKNLLRLLPEDKIAYIPPGIRPENFTACNKERQQQRSSWQAGQETIIFSAAMMRPGVKTEGLATIIKDCASLVQSGIELQLVIAGDGSCRSQLEALASARLGPRVRFLGRIARKEMYRYYSAADIFAFPGVEESLGMVYLEAQSCGLPVVAFSNWGGKEAVANGQTGLLAPAEKPDLLRQNLRRLIEKPELRAEMGARAANHIRTRHDLRQNYDQLEGQLARLVTPHQT